MSSFLAALTVAVLFVAALVALVEIIEYNSRASHQVPKPNERWQRESDKGNPFDKNEIMIVAVENGWVQYRFIHARRDGEVYGPGKHSMTIDSLQLSYTPSVTYESN